MRASSRNRALYALGIEKVVLASQSAAGVSKVMNSGSGKFVEPGTTSAVSMETYARNRQHGRPVGGQQAHGRLGVSAAAATSCSPATSPTTRRTPRRCR